jgi:formylglycine-generating enzyme required for sulfatase activity
VTDVQQIASRQKCSVRQVNMTISLAFLAPKLVRAAVEGRLPRGIGVERLRDAPAEWSHWWGDAFASAQANCARGDRELIPASADDLQPIAGTRPLPVQSFAPNPWGFYQVHGNVYDWVEDCWNGNYDGAPSDGSAWTNGNCDVHVLRGGAFSRAAQTARSAARLWSGSPNRMTYMSLRVARTMER